MYEKKTIVEIALTKAPEFRVLVDKLTKSFSILEKSTSTLNNYLSCLAHVAIH